MSCHRNVLVTFIFPNTGYFKMVIISPLNFLQGKQAIICCAFCNSAHSCSFPSVLSNLVTPFCKWAAQTITPHHRAGNTNCSANPQHICPYVLTLRLLFPLLARNVCWFVSIFLALSTANQEPNHWSLLVSYSSVPIKNSTAAAYLPQSPQDKHSPL